MPMYTSNTVPFTFAFASSFITKPSREILLKKTKENPFNRFNVTSCRYVNIDRDFQGQNCALNNHTSAQTPSRALILYTSDLHIKLDYSTFYTCDRCRTKAVYTRWNVGVFLQGQQLPSTHWKTALKSIYMHATYTSSDIDTADNHVTLQRNQKNTCINS